jgi:hypothetical protein
VAHVQAALIDFALDVMRDEKYDVRERLKAHHWLADRGFGRPPQTVEITDNRLKVDLSKLTDEQLAEYEKLSAIVQAEADAEDESDDVEAAEDDDIAT